VIGSLFGTRSAFSRLTPVLVQLWCQDHWPGIRCGLGLGSLVRPA
jgi:hypothetical protein